MTKTTTRGISYAESTDGTTIPAQLQGTATTTDSAIGVSDTARANYAATQPFAFAAVTVTISGSGASNYSQAFTWPVGRFTQAPAALFANNGGTGSSSMMINLTSVTTSGGTALAWNRDGATSTLTALVAHIIGLQMTSGAAFG